MAMSFFRRRQKMVLVIMAVLMVSFLVGGYGFTSLFSGRGGAARVVGECRLGKITNDDIARAETDLQLLSLINRRVIDIDFETLRSQPQAALGYAMLMKEAEQSSIRLGPDEDDEFLAQRGLTGPDMQNFLSQARTNFTGVNESYVRNTVGRWLHVLKNYNQFNISSPPSQQELAHLYRNLVEKLNLKLVKIKAEDFLKQVGEPNDQDLTAQFTAYRNAPPDNYSANNPFGFGYLQDNKARILYLFARQGVIERVSRPTDEAVRAYYRQHAQEFVREVSTQPAGDKAVEGNKTATAPASAPARREPMTFTEAKGQIIQKLSADEAQVRMERVAGEAEKLIRDFASSSEATKLNAYQWTLRRLMVPADAVLAMKLEGLRIEAQPLDKAMASLAAKASLSYIAFPWGRHGGDMTVDPNVKVTVKAESVTLQEALDQVCRQIKWPNLKWSMSKEFPDVLFSVAQDGSGVDFAPVAVKETPLLDAKAMKDDPILGESSTINRLPIMSLVFASEAFRPGQRNAIPLKVGQDGPRLLVAGAQPGRLLWRLMEAVPSEAPQNIDAVEGLREKVKDDVKLKAAFDLAVKRAQQIESQAAKTSLADVAKAQKLETIDTGMFTRMTADLPQEQYVAMARSTGRFSAAEYAQAKPFAFEWTAPPELGLTTESQARGFVETAFALAPENIEPPLTDTKPAVGTFQFPPLREVVVMQRIGYEPAAAGEFAKNIPYLSSQIENLHRWQSRVTWFDPRLIAQRTGFKGSQQSE